MIEAHTLDAWTRLADRHNSVYAWAMIVAGFAAPSFLLLAGVSLVLAIGSRIRRGRSEAEAAALARRRSLQIFGLAFLFRLQAIVISGGSLSQLLKVDILNVMGLSMLAAALLWSLGRSRWDRAAWFIAATVVVAMATPIVRATPVLSPLPDAIEWYLRPIGRSTFTLFPWAGFLLAGGAIGVLLDAARAPLQERRANIVLGAVGVLLAIGGYAASFLPAVYRETSFWTTSPTFFFVRLGILLVAFQVAYAWNTAWEGRSVLQEFGRASLFVYWIHVELAYGSLSSPIHKQLTLEEAFIAYALFSVALFGAAKLKDRIVEWWKQPRGPAFAGAAS
jgi:uncharacterized membrane protein